MDLQLHHVIASITGVTGMRSIRAIVDGERAPENLVVIRDARCSVQRKH